MILTIVNVVSEVPIYMISQENSQFQLLTEFLSINDFNFNFHI